MKRIAKGLILNEYKLSGEIKPVEVTFVFL